MRISAWSSDVCSSDLPRITDLRFEMDKGGETLVLGGSDLPGIDSRTVERLDLVLTISGPAPETLHIPAPVAIEYDDGLFWSFEEANILLAAPTAVTPAELDRKSVV